VESTIEYLPQSASGMFFNVPTYVLHLTLPQWATILGQDQHATSAIESGG
jgi:hypothetical protein